MLSSILTSVLFAGLAAASVRCPIKPYDAKPGYDIACVYGDQRGVYEDRLVKDIEIVGSMYTATLPFECVREHNNANWLGYDYGGRLCYVTEGNVEGEDKAACFKRLLPCNPAGY